MQYKFKSKLLKIVIIKYIFEIVFNNYKRIVPHYLTMHALLMAVIV